MQVSRRAAATSDRRPSVITVVTLQPLSNEADVVSVKVRQDNVLQRDRVGRVEGDHRIRSHLRGRGKHGLEIGEQRIVELEDVARPGARKSVIESRPKPRLNTKTSLPAPPVSVSLPEPPAIVSATLKRGRSYRPRDTHLMPHPPSVTGSKLMILASAFRIASFPASPRDSESWI